MDDKTKSILYVSGMLAFGRQFCYALCFLAPLAAVVPAVAAPAHTNITTSESVPASFDSQNSARWQTLDRDRVRLHLLQDGKTHLYDMDPEYRAWVQSVKYKNKDQVAVTRSRYRSREPETLVYNLNTLSGTSDVLPKVEPLKPVQPRVASELHVELTTSALPLSAGAPSVRIVDMIGGTANGIAIDSQRQRLCLAEGNCITMYDIFAKSAPREIGKQFFARPVKLPILCEDQLTAVIDNNLLVVCDVTTNGLQIKSTIQLPGDATRARAAGERVYVAGSFGLVMVDLAERPCRAYDAGLPEVAVKDLLCSGTIGAINDNFYGLQLVDFADPLRPALLADKDESHLANALRDQQLAFQVLFDNKREALMEKPAHETDAPRFLTEKLPDTEGGYSRTTPVIDGNLAAANLSNGLNADSRCIVFTINSDRTSAVVCATIPLLGTASHLAVSGRDLAVGSERKLLVLSPNEKTLRLRGSLQVPGSINDMFSSGPAIILGTYNGEIIVVDISNPDTPHFRCSEKNKPTNDYIKQIAPVGDRVVIATSGNLKVASPGDCFSSAPLLYRASSNYSYAWPITDQIIAAVCGHQLVTMQLPNDRDVATVLTTQTMQNWAFGFDGQGALACAVGNGKLQVIDGINPRHPRLRGLVEIDEYEDVTISGLYAAAYSNRPGMALIDLSNADEPRLLASAFPDLNISDVAFANNQFYAACGDAGLLVMEYDGSELAPADQPLFSPALFEAAILALPNGGTAALDRLEKLTQPVREKEESDPPTDGSRLIELTADSFDILGESAAQGNVAAREAILNSMQRPKLRSWAGFAVGRAAALGDQEMIDFLVDYKTNSLLQCEAVMHLVAPAQKGYPKAITFLAGQTKDINNRSLWFMVMDGLSSATVSGNRTAITAAGNVARKDLTGQSHDMAINALLKSAAGGHKAAKKELLRIGKSLE